MQNIQKLGDIKVISTGVSNKTIQGGCKLFQSLSGQ